MPLHRAQKPRHAKPSRRKATTVATGTAMVLALDLAGASSASAHDRSFPTMLAELRGCESGGNYGINTGNGYYGAYQFNLQTWRGVGGTGYPHQNPPHVQDEMATRLYESRGWGPWPSCSRKLGLHATTVERPWAGHAPQGSVDAISTRPGAISLRGWAFDRDVPDPLDVHVYVDGVGRALQTGIARPDVHSAYGHGSHSGWHLATTAAAGRRHVCVYALGGGPGAAHTSLGCFDVDVPADDSSVDPSSTAQFSDAVGGELQHAVEALAARGIVLGSADGGFRPDALVTRGQTAAFLQRAFELPAATATAPYSDTAASPHADAIAAVAEAGIAGGFADGTFRPDAEVTRDQMATFLQRALQLEGCLPAPFTDVAGSTHEDAICGLAGAGTSNGYADGSYRPHLAVTRGQTALLLARALGL